MVVVVVVVPDQTLLAFRKVKCLLSEKNCGYIKTRGKKKTKNVNTEYIDPRKLSS